MTIKREQDYSNDVKIAVLQNTNIHIHEALTDIKMKLTQMDSKFESRFDKLDNRIWQLMLWTMAGFAGVLGLIAHAFKWI